MAANDRLCQESYRIFVIGVSFIETADHLGTVGYNALNSSSKLEQHVYAPKRLEVDELSKRIKP